MAPLHTYKVTYLHLPTHAHHNHHCQFSLFRSTCSLPFRHLFLSFYNFPVLQNLIFFLVPTLSLSVFLSFVWLFSLSVFLSLLIHRRCLCVNMCEREKDRERESMYRLSSFVFIQLFSTSSPTWKRWNETKNKTHSLTIVILITKRQRRRRLFQIENSKPYIRYRETNAVIVLVVIVVVVVSTKLLARCQKIRLNVPIRYKRKTILKEA